MKISSRLRYLNTGFSPTHECVGLYWNAPGTQENSQHVQLPCALPDACHSVPQMPDEPPVLTTKNDPLWVSKRVLRAAQLLLKSAVHSWAPWLVRWRGLFRADPGEGRLNLLCMKLQDPSNPQT